MVSETTDETQACDDADVAAAKEKLKEAEAKAKAAKQKREQRHAASLAAAAAEFVAEHPRLFFVARNNWYGEWAHGEWHWMTERALTTNYADVMTIQHFPKAFKVEMQRAGRCFYDCVHAFSEVPGKLNLLVRDNWLKPRTGEHHFLFDRLMQSIGGGKDENVEHLERCIAYKVEHPDCI